MKKQIIPVVVAAIINQKNQFLLTKRSEIDEEDSQSYRDYWQLPGGSVEFGEKPEETLHREMKEELGTQVNIISLLPKIFTEIRQNWQGVFIVYLCQLKNPHAKIILNSEASEYGWYTLDEVLKLNTLPGTTAIIKEVRAHYKKLSAGGEI